MEFLRFGSSIPGRYWGCCACCIIQNFDFDPDEPAAIELVEGDGGTPLQLYNAETDSYNPAYAGMTYREIFETRIRIGTFSLNEMPNHAFFAIMTDWQLCQSYGRKWLEILKANGFEFIRTVDNSVYSGSSLLSGNPSSAHPNYIFGLIRNIGRGAIVDPFTPPKQWLDIKGPEGMEEAHEFIKDGEGLAERQRVAHTAIWQAGETKIRTLEEVKAAGVPIEMAGLRSQMPQQPESERSAALKANPDYMPSQPCW